MYKIYADNTLIYDGTIEDYKIGKGVITLEVNKSGSFVFSVYPDHFYYDQFIRLKTVITVYKAGKIIFRGRILSDVTDYWNNKVITCEGELGFLQDSIVRPYDFKATPQELFAKLIMVHNAQVDDFKKFKIGTITVKDPNDYIARSNSEYESTLSNINSRLVEGSLGGYIHINHGEDGTDPIPTINYLADFTKVSSQTISFGKNLKNYTKTVKAENIATAIIPLGAEIDDGDDLTENRRLTIESVNDDVDYVYSEEGVALYGLIYKTMTWDDVTDASNLKAKAEATLDEMIKQNVTIELNAVDLHLLDRSIESFSINQYVRVFSTPHNFDETLLCHKQTIDLLKPENDSITLGHTYSAFTETSAKTISAITSIGNIRSNVVKLAERQKDYVDPKAQLPSLMAQSLGFFQSVETLENGSSIYYLHDETTLENSKTIWKMTADAFGVSTDGGKTWKAGLTSDGDTVVNILSAVGIKAEWLDVDNLSAISANIAGWNIDGDGLYKEIIDATNSNNVYRVHFNAPTSKSARVLTCQKSTNGGKTFDYSFILYADGSAKFGNTQIGADGYFKMTLPNDYSLRFTDSGVWFFNKSNESLGGLLLIDGKLRLQVQNVDWETIFDNPGYTGTITAYDESNKQVSLNFYNGILSGVY